MNPNEWCFRLKRLLILIAALTLATSASAQWKEKVLYSFQGGSDGAFPAGGVVFDKQGNLYGATQQGGGTNCSPIGYCGTVYQLAPPAKQGDPWTETILHVFQGKAQNDGEYPSGGVIADTAGNIYGTASYGGTGDCVLLGIKGGCGTVFELSPPQTKGGQWTYTTLYSFKGGKDGYLPFGDLVFDSAGNLYGATYFGGGKGTTCNSYYQYCGAIFELSPPTKKVKKWTEKVVYSFKGIKAGKQVGDGANPNGGLILDIKGAIYGTTFIGGFNCSHNSGQGCGTVFKLTPPIGKGSAWTEELLNRFNPGNSGAAEPAAGVVFDKGGILYGTTQHGGDTGSGTVFQLAPGSNGKWVDRVLYRFRDGNDGSEPRSGVVFDAKGDLYGTATGGGAEGNGTVFRLRPGAKSWSFVTGYGFGIRPDGAYPVSRLIVDSTGSFYGTTQYGGSGQTCGNYGCGTVFTTQK
jgi:uncharacterized repeat protein (TIGR03803 family)